MTFPRTSSLLMMFVLARVLVAACGRKKYLQRVDVVAIKFSKFFRTGTNYHSWTLHKSEAHLFGGLDEGVRADRIEGFRGYPLESDSS